MFENHQGVVFDSSATQIYDRLPRNTQKKIDNKLIQILEAKKGQILPFIRPLKSEKGLFEVRIEPGIRAIVSLSKKGILLVVDIVFKRDDRELL